MGHVEFESRTAGAPTKYNNVQGATRNAKDRTLTEGRCWQFMDVDKEMVRKGSDFRLWTITEEMIPRPHVAWQEGGAKVVMMQGDPDCPRVEIYPRPDLSEHIERSGVEIAERRDLLAQRREAGGGGGSTVAAATQARRREEPILSRPAPSLFPGYVGEERRI
jgi:hypothetical protein